jgi:NitT/TauT family transport system ATP-binding protein
LPECKREGTRLHAKKNDMSILMTLLGALFDGLPLIPLAVGFVWTLRYQKVADLSLAGSFSVAAGCVAYLMNAGYGTLPSIAVGLLVGAVVGGLMGITVNILRLEPLLAGLVVLFITYAVSLGLTQGTIRIAAAHNPLEPVFAAEMKWGLPLGSHAAVNFIFLLLAAGSVGLTDFVLASEWGCAFRTLEDLIGGRHFLRSLGLTPGRISSIGFSVAGLLAAISGILVALRDRQTTSSLGLETLIDIIPAYLLGITLFERRPTLNASQAHQAGSPSVLRNTGKHLLLIVRRLKSLPPSLAAALGVLVFYFAINLAQRGALFSWLPRVLLGLFLIVVLGISPALQSYRQRRRQHLSTAIIGQGKPLEINQLDVAYATSTGPKQVLHNVRLTAYPQEVILLKGPNGCGKSTLLRALADRIECVGKFSIPVADGLGANGSRAKVVAYVPQDADENTVATLSIAEHAVLAMCGDRPSLLRRWRKHADSAYAKLGVGDVSPDPQTLLRWLSGGQRRRVLLGLLAVRNPGPTVIAMDEPFNDLDAPGRSHCHQVISQLASNGHIILLVDHQQQFQSTRSEDHLWL